MEFHLAAFSKVAIDHEKSKRLALPVSAKETIAAIKFLKAQKGYWG